MASLMSRAAKFARSPQGKRIFAEAQKLAKDPERRRQLDDARRRLTSRGKQPPPG